MSLLPIQKKMLAVRWGIQGDYFRMLPVNFMTHLDPACCHPGNPLQFVQIPLFSIDFLLNSLAVGIDLAPFSDVPGPMSFHPAVLTGTGAKLVAMAQGQDSGHLLRQISPSSDLDYRFVARQRHNYFTCLSIANELIPAVKTSLSAFFQMICSDRGMYIPHNASANLVDLCTIQLNSNQETGTVFVSIVIPPSIELPMATPFGYRPSLVFPRKIEISFVLTPAARYGICLGDQIAIQPNGTVVFDGDRREWEFVTEHWHALVPNPGELRHFFFRFPYLLKNDQIPVSFDLIWQAIWGVVRETTAGTPDITCFMDKLDRFIKSHFPVPDESGLKYLVLMKQICDFGTKIAAFSTFFEQARIEVEAKITEMCVAGHRKAPQLQLDWLPPLPAYTPTRFLPSSLCGPTPILDAYTPFLSGMLVEILNGFVRYLRFSELQSIHEFDRRRWDDARIASPLSARTPTHVMIGQFIDEVVDLSLRAHPSIPPLLAQLIGEVCAHFKAGLPSVPPSELMPAMRAFLSQLGTWIDPLLRDSESVGNNGMALFEIADSWVKSCASETQKASYHAALAPFLLRVIVSRLSDVMPEHVAQLKPVALRSCSTPGSESEGIELLCTLIRLAPELWVDEAPAVKSKKKVSQKKVVIQEISIKISDLPRLSLNAQKALLFSLLVPEAYRVVLSGATPTTFIDCTTPLLLEDGRFEPALVGRMCSEPQVFGPLLIRQRDEWSDELDERMAIITADIISDWAAYLSVFIPRVGSAHSFTAKEGVTFADLLIRSIKQISDTTTQHRVIARVIPDLISRFQNLFPDWEGVLLFIVGSLRREMSPENRNAVNSISLNQLIQDGHLYEAVWQLSQSGHSASEAISILFPLVKSRKGGHAVFELTPILRVFFPDETPLTDAVTKTVISKVIESYMDQSQGEVLELLELFTIPYDKLSDGAFQKITRDLHLKAIKKIPKIAEQLDRAIIGRDWLSPRNGSASASAKVGVLMWLCRNDLQRLVEFSPDIFVDIVRGLNTLSTPDKTTEFISSVFFIASSPSVRHTSPLLALIQIIAACYPLYTQSQRVFVIRLIESIKLDLDTDAFLVLFRAIPARPESADFTDVKLLGTYWAARIFAPQHAATLSDSLPQLCFDALSQTPTVVHAFATGFVATMAEFVTDTTHRKAVVTRFLSRAIPLAPGTLELAAPGWLLPHEPARAQFEFFLAFFNQYGAILGAESFDKTGSAVSLLAHLLTEIDNPTDEDMQKIVDVLSNPKHIGILCNLLCKIGSISLLPGNRRFVALLFFNLLLPGEFPDDRHLTAGLSKALGIPLLTYYMKWAHEFPDLIDRTQLIQLLDMLADSTHMFMNVHRQDAWQAHLKFLALAFSVLQQFQVEAAGAEPPLSATTLIGLETLAMSLFRNANLHLILQQDYVLDDRDTMVTLVTGLLATVFVATVEDELADTFIRGTGEARCPDAYFSPLCLAFHQNPPVVEATVAAISDIGDRLRHHPRFRTDKMEELAELGMMFFHSPEELSVEGVHGTSKAMGRILLHLVDQMCTDAPEGSARQLVRILQRDWTNPMFIRTAYFHFVRKFDLFNLDNPSHLFWRAEVARNCLDDYVRPGIDVNTRAQAMVAFQDHLETIMGTPVASHSLLTDFLWSLIGTDEVRAHYKAVLPTLGDLEKIYPRANRVYITSKILEQLVELMATIDAGSPAFRSVFDHRYDDTLTGLAYQIFTHLSERIRPRLLNSPVLTLSKTSSAVLGLMQLLNIRSARALEETLMMFIERALEVKARSVNRQTFALCAIQQLLSVFIIEGSYQSPLSVASKKGKPAAAERMPVISQHNFELLGIYLYLIFQVYKYQELSEEIVHSYFLISAMVLKTWAVQESGGMGQFDFGPDRLFELIEFRRWVKDPAVVAEMSAFLARNLEKAGPEHSYFIRNPKTHLFAQLADRLA